MKSNIQFIILLPYISIFSFSHLFAQQQNYLNFSNPAFDIKTNYSFVLPHHKKMIHLNESHFCYYELSYSRNTKGNKHWHQLYNFPSYGLTFQYNNLGNSNILGTAYAFYPYINQNIIKRKHFFAHGRFGAGFAYLTKKFDKNSNHKNVAISTNFNICINMGIEFQQNLMQNLSLFQGLGITHFSNGAFRMPNTGINIPYASLGIKYTLPTMSDTITVAPENKDIKKKYFFSMMGAAGIKELYPSYGNKYPAFTLNVGFNWQKSCIQILSLNFDLFYNLANFETLKRKNIITSKCSVLRPGIAVSNEFVFGETSFIFLVGRYLYAKDDSDGMIYNRLGFKRKVNDNIFLNLTLKSHFFVADFVEWGLGYNF